MKTLIDFIKSLRSYQGDEYEHIKYTFESPYPNRELFEKIEGVCRRDPKNQEPEGRDI